MTQYDFIQWLENNGYKMVSASLSRIYADGVTRETYIYTNGKITLNIKINK